MVSLKYNKPASLTIRYVGGRGRLDLPPGITLNACSADEWKFIEVHPVVASLLQLRELEVLTREPSTTEMKVEDKDSGHSATHTVTRADDAATGQPMPVTGSTGNSPMMQVPDLTPQPVALKLLNSATTEAELIPLPSVGEATAKALLGKRPTDGYESLDQAEEIHSDKPHIQWEAIALWEG